MDEFVIAIFMNLWLWFRSMQLFSNIKQEIHMQSLESSVCVVLLISYICCFLLAASNVFISCFSATGFKGS